MQGKTIGSTSPIRSRVNPPFPTSYNKYYFCLYFLSCLKRNLCCLLLKRLRPKLLTLWYEKSAACQSDVYRAQWNGITCWNPTIKSIQGNQWIILILFKYITKKLAVSCWQIWFWYYREIKMVPDVKNEKLLHLYFSDYCMERVGKSRSIYKCVWKLHMR